MSRAEAYAVFELTDAVRAMIGVLDPCVGQCQCGYCKKVARLERALGALTADKIAIDKEART